MDFKLYLDILIQKTFTASIKNILLLLHAGVKKIRIFKQSNQRIFL